MFEIKFEIQILVMIGFDCCFQGFEPEDNYNKTKLNLFSTTCPTLYEATDLILRLIIQTLDISYIKSFNT